MRGVVFFLRFLPPSRGGSVIGLGGATPATSSDDRYARVGSPFASRSSDCIASHQSSTGSLSTGVCVRARLRGRSSVNPFLRDYAQDLHLRSFVDTDLQLTLLANTTVYCVKRRTAKIGLIIRDRDISHEAVFQVLDTVSTAVSRMRRVHPPIQLPVQL